MTSYQNEPRSVAERVAYIEGRLGMDYGTTSDGSSEDWRARSAWSRGRSAYWDERNERKFRILMALQVATAFAVVAGILILS